MPPLLTGQIAHAQNLMGSFPGGEPAGNTNFRGPDFLGLATTEPGNHFLAGGDLKAHSLLWGEHQLAD